MGTVADKLNYLNETKEDIKNALINKGVTVNDNDTFRSYANKILDVQSGLDTSDATATAEHISEGYIAYSKGERIVGTAQLADPEVMTSLISSIDNSLGAKVTKFPSNMTSIGDYAFYNCINLSIKELPENIISIGAYAFRGCDGLTSFTIKGKVSEIQNQTFNGSSNLTALIFKNVTSIPTLKSSVAFSGTPIADGNGYIYVPDNLVNGFKSATNWSKFVNQIKGLSELEV